MQPALYERLLFLAVKEEQALLDHLSFLKDNLKDLPVLINGKILLESAREALTLDGYLDFLEFASGILDDEQTVIWESLACFERLHSGDRRQPDATTTNSKQIAQARGLTQTILASCWSMRHSSGKTNGFQKILRQFVITHYNDAS